MAAEFPKTPSAPEELARRISDALPLDLLLPDSLDEVARRWCERHRVWHNGAHLSRLIERIHDASHAADRDVLLLTALYHDAIYDPRRGDNEEASAVLLQAHAIDPDHPVIKQAIRLTVASKWSEPPCDDLTWKFWEMDCEALSTDYPLGARPDYERAIFREYQWAPWPVYRTKRAEFLEAWGAGRRYVPDTREIYAMVE